MIQVYVLCTTTVMMEEIQNFHHILEDQDLDLSPQVPHLPDLV